MDGFTLQNKNNIWFGSFSAFTQAGFGNAFSCRLHGESSLVPGGFNLALHVGDDAEKVLSNRQKYAAALGVAANKFTCCEQVHGDVVAIIDEAAAGKGALAYADAVKGTDALVTNLTDVPLLLFFADCVPVIFADPVTGCIGLAHVERLRISRRKLCRKCRKLSAQSCRISLQASGPASAAAVTRWTIPFTMPVKNTQNVLRQKATANTWRIYLNGTGSPCWKRACCRSTFTAPESARNAIRSCFSPIAPRAAKPDAWA